MSRLSGSLSVPCLLLYWLFTVCCIGCLLFVVLVVYCLLYWLFTVCCIGCIGCLLFVVLVVLVVYCLLYWLFTVGCIGCLLFVVLVVYCLLYWLFTVCCIGCLLFVVLVVYCLLYWLFTVCCIGCLLFVVLVVYCLLYWLFTVCCIGCLLLLVLVIVVCYSGWYHQVRNVAPTISINHNWSNAFCLCTLTSHLRHELKLVEDELSDCQAMTDWTEHCQVRTHPHVLLIKFEVADCVDVVDFTF